MDGGGFRQLYMTVGSRLVIVGGYRHLWVNFGGCGWYKNAASGFRLLQVVRGGCIL